MIAAPALALRVVDVAVERGPNATEVRIRFDGPAPGADLSLLPGPRLVLDIPGAAAGSARPSVPGDGDRVTRVRLGQHRDYLRVVLDLVRAAPFRRRTEDSAVVVTIGGVDAPTAPGAPSAATAGEPRPSARPRGAPPRRIRERSGTLLPSSEPLDPAPEAAEPPPPRSSGVLLPGTRPPPEPGILLPGAPSLPPSLEEPAAAPAEAPTNPPEPRERPAAPTAAPAPSETPAPPDERRAAPSATAQPTAARRPSTPSPVEAEEPSPRPSPSARRPTATPAARSTASAPAPAATTAAPSSPAASPADAAKREAARVSLEFREVDIRTLLDLIARAGGHEVIFRPEVQGKIGVSAVDRPWREVFEDVLRRARLKAVEHDGLFLVSPDRGR